MPKKNQNKILQNPWADLPAEPPLVLPKDKEAVASFNVKKEHTIYKIETNIMPEPYIGNPDAPVVLLSLNPGFVDDEDALDFMGNRLLVSLCRANLLHEMNEWPLYYFHPEIRYTAGYRWWNAKLKELISEVGLKTLANRFFVIEYFPYHSIRFKPMRQTLPSQEYSAFLLRKALQRKATVILMRGEAHWLKLVTELEDYAYYTLRSSQNVAISRKNLVGDFDYVVNIMRN